MTILAVSLKQYFGYRRTLEWSMAISDIVAADRAAVGAISRSPHDSPGPTGPDGSDHATEVVIVPSFPALPAVHDIVAKAGIAVGAQDLSALDAPAQTGEVLGAMIAEIGCRFVEVGHAERRQMFGETEQVVAAKTAAAFRHGLTPILCLGERSKDSAAAAAAECRRQLRSALEVTRQAGLTGRLVVAYEPFWAIGAAEPASETHIADVCGDLQEAVAELGGHSDSAVIYGGSAGPGLLSRLGNDIDGLFLGRFAHDPEAFRAVLAEATQSTQATHATQGEGAA